MKFSSMLRDRRTFQESGEGAGATPPGDGGAPPATPPGEAGPDLSFIPEDFHTDGAPDLTKFAPHYQELVARDAQASERAAAVPESYDFTVPADMKFDGLDLPEGFALQPLTDDPAMQPLFSELGGVLKDMGAPAEAAGKLTGLLARYEATRYSQGMARVKADMETLGSPTQVKARVGTIERAIDTKLPPDQASALKATMTSAKAIQALETLLGPRGFSPSQTPKPPKTVQDDINDYYRNPTR